MPSRLTFLDDLRVLFARFGLSWRRRAAVLLALTFVGAIAELMVIGAIVPFLAIIADPAGEHSGWLVRTVVRYVPRIGPDMTSSVATLFIVMALIAAAIRLTLARTTYWFVFAIGHELSVAVYSRLIDQPYSFHLSKNSSEGVAATNWAVDVTHNMVLPIVQSFSAITIAFFIVCALFVVDPTIAGMTIVSFGLLYTLPSYFARHRLLANGRMLRAMNTERIKVMQEGLGGIRDILLDQAQPIYAARFDAVDRVIEHRMRENVFMAAAPRFIIESLGMVLIAALAMYLAGRPGGVYTALPTLGALAIGAQRMMPLFQMVYQSWTQIVTTRGAFEGLLEIGKLPRRSYGAVAPLFFRKAIELEDVSFAYQNGITVLDTVSLTIRRGASVAFVGQTGSGKSTLVDLIMGLLNPVAGTVQIDGVVLDEATRRGWQDNIAHVAQNIYLADASLAENIAFGVPRDRIDRARVVVAARNAELGDFIDSLPDGLDTGVGERGVRLSGGQRQRIGIARALYKRAPVLVLDEATSALDERTEAAVMRNLDQLGEGLTVLMIAHRLSTVRRCDTIFRLDKGRIVAAGPPDAVLGPQPQSAEPAVGPAAGIGA